MKRTALIIILLIFALVAVCAAIGVVGFFTLAPRVSSLPDFRIGVNQVSAQAQEQNTYPVTGTVTLDLETPFGNIDLVSGQEQQVVVTADKTAWGGNAQEAEAALARLQVKTKQEGNRITIRIEQDNDPLRNMQTGSVDFTLTVPVSTTVIAHTQSGRITLQGTSGKADLSSDFGDIEINEVSGGVAASSRSGKVTARSIDLLPSDEGDVSLQSDFGDLSLEDTQTGQVTLSTRSGSVRLANVVSNGEVSLESDFGTVSFQTGEAASLTIQARSGEVTLDNLSISNALSIQSDFSNFRLTQAQAASYELKTGSGSITLNGAAGRIEAYTDNGDIDISNAENTVLSAETKTGKVTFRGSLSDGPHRVESDFGQIRLTLPESSQFSFDLQTNFGKIKSEFPVQIQGEPDENHWVGQVGQGGQTLTAVTQNGDIVLEMSKP